MQVPQLECAADERRLPMRQVIAGPLLDRLA
jgi:hypothetical protein